jgi:L-seryl-tRNA(Ser) seleniumtransferase
MARALRVDKMTYAALEATLLSFVEGKATREVPVLRMLAASRDEIRARCDELVRAVDATDGALALTVEPATSRVGGGAAADAAIPTWVIAITKRGVSADALLTALREHHPPVVARIVDDRVLVDLRTVMPENDATVRDAIRDL